MVRGKDKIRLGQKPVLNLKFNFILSADFVGKKKENGFQVEFYGFK